MVTTEVVVLGFAVVVPGFAVALLLLTAEAVLTEGCFDVALRVTTVLWCAVELFWLVLNLGELAVADVRVFP